MSAPAQLQLSFNSNLVRAILLKLEIDTTLRNAVGNRQLKEI